MFECERGEYMNRYSFDLKITTYENLPLPDALNRLPPTTQAEDDFTTARVQLLNGSAYRVVSRIRNGGERDKNGVEATESVLTTGCR